MNSSSYRPSFGLGSRNLCYSLATSIGLLGTLTMSDAEVVAGWNMGTLPGGSVGSGGYGPSPMAATVNSPNVTVGGLTRGSGVTTTGTSAARAWGGLTWNSADAAAAVTAGQYATFTITPNAGYTVSLQSISRFDYRRSGTGAVSGTLQYQVGAGAFTDITTVSYTSSASAGASLGPFDLSDKADLQNVAPGNTVTFRIVNFGASASGGTWYVYDVANNANNDLEISGLVTPVGLTPIVVSVTPSTFAEDAGAAAASGTVSVPTAPAANLTINLGSSDTTEATVPATVTILAGETSATFPVNAIADGAYDPSQSVTITASTVTPGYAEGQTSVTVTNVDTVPTLVVINKYLNSPDMIELLVIGANTPGSTADMRGMIIKDHSASMGSDGGGKYQFNSASAFAAVPAGTLIILSTGSTSTDTDASDFVLRLGLGDTSLFTLIGGAFDVATTEAVMIKAAGTDSSGGIGAMHTLAGGTEGVQFTNAPAPKLIALGASASGKGVIANNSTATLADFSGTDATGDVSLTATDFGLPNNASNNTYIRFLRGQTTLSGTGVGSITNETAASPFQGKNIFPRTGSGQTASVTVQGNVISGNIASVRITVPASFGTPSTGSVAVTGAGAGTPVVSVSGQVVTVSGLAIDVANTATVAIGGLATPNPTGVTDDGNYPFGLETAGTAQTLGAVAVSPAARVIIPIASLRDVDANGLPLDSAKVVAIEGVCTMGNFIPGTTTSAYLQDGNYGINVFKSGSDLGLIRGHRYAVTGSVIQFNGLSEVNPAGPEALVDLGTDTEPTPLTVTIGDLLANAEAYEGRVLQVENLTYVSGTWGIGQPSPVVLKNAGGDTLDILIQPGSTAGTEPAYPATIIGILGQNDTASPYTATYRLQPRDQADIISTVVACQYATWAAANGIAGSPADGDADLDGIKNLTEYALGTDPLIPTTMPNLIPAGGGDFTISFTKGATAGADAALAYVIETSTDMLEWLTVSPTVNDATTISATIPGNSGKRFARLRVICP